MGPTNLLGLQGYAGYNGYCGYNGSHKKNSIKCENYMGIRVVAHASPPGSRGLLWLYWLSRFFAKQIPLIEII